MKTIAMLILMLICFVGIAEAYTIPVTAAPYPFGTSNIKLRLNLIINANGGVDSFNVDPYGGKSYATSPIEYVGNNYNLTKDIDGDISVLRSNTILNGNGYFVHGEVTVGDWGNQLYQPTAALALISNVTVENFNVYGSKIMHYGILEETKAGINLILSSNATIANNTITLAGDNVFSDKGEASAIDVEGGSSNVVIGNDLRRNWMGMIFHETTNNLIIENNITTTHNPDYPAWGTLGFGIAFWRASNNTVYHNNFVDNDVQAYNGTSVNVWDNGYPNGGNYWSDWQATHPNASEPGTSLIGTTTYVIDSQNKDRYPLIQPFNSTFELQTAPKILLLSPSNKTYIGPSVPLVFSEDKMANWMGYSLDGQKNQTVTGNSTLTGLSSGVHFVTVYANNTFGNMGTSETTIFDIKEPFPVSTIIAVTIASVVVIALGLLIFRGRRGVSKQQTSAA